MEERQYRKVKCGKEKCGYVWITKSKMDWTTCPKCQLKTKIIEIAVLVDEE